MGNSIFRYFLEWLRQEMREEAYAKYMKQAERRAKARMHHQAATEEGYLPGWMAGPIAGLDEWWNHYFSKDDEGEKHEQLWELAQIEGDEAYIEWLEAHIWTYVGLSAPVLGAVNPLRAVLSGEKMGLPMSDDAARIMELSFGSTHTVNPISSKMAFCDQWDVEEWGEEPDNTHPNKDLFCLDDLMNEIENSRPDQDPWADFPVLKNLLKDRMDWDSAIPMISIVEETCGLKEKSPCANRTTSTFGPRDVQNGHVFTKFSEIWKEEGEPLVIKRHQLNESFWSTGVPNMLNKTWE